jgi:hypothetical protein
MVELEVVAGGSEQKRRIEKARVSPEPLSIVRGYGGMARQ